MSRIGFIGTGAIAAPMIRHLVSKGHSITATKRSEHVSQELARTHGITIADHQDVVDNSDIVFLCLRPHQVDAIEPLRFRADQQVVSAMASTPREKLAELCAPVADFVQTIPFAFLEKGGCPLPAFGNTGLLAELFAPENPIIPVRSEEALNAHFAACTLIPAVLDLMNTGAGWLAEQTGDPDGAEAYTTQLINGFLTTKDQTLAIERDGLATEATLSLQMTTALQDGGAHNALLGALEAISERLKQA